MVTLARILPCCQESWECCILTPAPSFYELTPSCVQCHEAPLDPIKGCHPHPPPLPEMIDGEEEWVVKRFWIAE